MMIMTMIPLIMMHQTRLTTGMAPFFIVFSIFDLMALMRWGQASSPTTAPSTPPKFEGRWTFSETVWNRTSILVWCIFRPEDIFACLIVFFKNSSYFTCGQDHWPRSQLWEWSGLQKTQRLVVENGKRRGVKMSKETGFKRKTRRLKRKTRKTLEATHLLFSSVCTCAFSPRFFPAATFLRFLIEAPNPPCPGGQDPNNFTFEAQNRLIWLGCGCRCWLLALVVVTGWQ